MVTVHGRACEGLEYSSHHFGAWWYAGKASLFTLSSSNAMVQLVSRGGPRILQTQVRMTLLVMQDSLYVLLRLTPLLFVMLLFLMQDSPCVLLPQQR